MSGVMSADTWASVPEGQGPFVGPRALDARDIGLVFGFEHHLPTMLSTLRTRRVLHVVGPPGVGKSSCVRAALLPALRLGLLRHVDGKEDRWLVADMAASADPIRGLARALVAAMPDAADPLGHDRAHVIDAALRQGGDGLLTVARELCGRFDARLVIVFDGLEDQMRLGGADAWKGLFEQVILAVRQLDVPVHVVTSLRMGALGRVCESSALEQLMSDGLYFLPGPDERLLADMVEMTAVARGARIHPDLAARVSADAEGIPYGLSRMQHAMARAWGRPGRVGGEPLLEEAYVAVGGVATSGPVQLQEMLQGWSPDNQRLARLTLNALGRLAPDKWVTVATLARHLRLEPTPVCAIVAAFSAPEVGFLGVNSGEAINPQTAVRVAPWAAAFLVSDPAAAPAHAPIDVEAFDDLDDLDVELEVASGHMDAHSAHQAGGPPVAVVVMASLALLVGGASLGAWVTLVAMTP